MNFYFLDDVKIIRIPEANEASSSTVIESSFQNFKFVENLINYFDSVEFLTLSKDFNQVYLLKLQIEESSSNPNAKELDVLAQKCSKNSIVVLLASRNEKNFFLYWKSREIQQFLSLKIYDECELMNNLKLFDFIANFLADSLTRGYLGKYYKFLNHLLIENFH